MKSVLRDVFETFSVVDEEGFLIESFGDQNFMSFDFVENMLFSLKSLNFVNEDFILVCREKKNYCFLKITEHVFVIGELSTKVPFSKFVYFRLNIISEVMDLI